MGKDRASQVTFLSMLISIFCLASQSAAGPFRDPMIPDGQVLFYQYTSKTHLNPFLLEIRKGEEVETSVTEIRSYPDERGQKIYQVTDQGKRKNGYRLEHISELVVQQDMLKPRSFVARDVNQDGRTIREMRAFFDDPTVQYPEGTFPVFSAVQAMRGACFEKGTGVEFTLWIAPTEIFRMFVTIKDIESIEVPLGTIRCYLLEMKPDIRTILPVSNLLAKLIQPFLPEYRFWFATEPSHFLVRFEGALGGAGAVKHIVELQKVELRHQDKG